MNSCDSLSYFAHWGSFSASVVPEGPSGTCISATSITGGATIEWQVENELGVTPVQAGNTLEVDFNANGPDFRITVLIDSTFYVLRDWAWGTGYWQHGSYVLPVSGNLKGVDFNYFGADHNVKLDNIVVTPEPATIALLGTAGLLALRKNRK
jgi:hypothetical protein